MDGYRTLVVEDDPMVQKFVSEILESKGMVPIRATTVREAIGHLREADIVLLDLNLPNGNGADVLKNLVSIRDDVPVVVMSGYPKESGLLEDLPFLTWVDKPVNTEMLMAALNDAIDLALSVRRIRESTDRIRSRVDKK